MSLKNGAVICADNGKLLRSFKSDDSDACRLGHYSPRKSRLPNPETGADHTLLALYLDIRTDSATSCIKVLSKKSDLFSPFASLWFYSHPGSHYSGGASLAELWKSLNKKANLSTLSLQAPGKKTSASQRAGLSKPGEAHAPRCRYRDEIEVITLKGIGKPDSRVQPIASIIFYWRQLRDIDACYSRLKRLLASVTLKIETEKKRRRHSSLAELYSGTPTLNIDDFITGKLEADSKEIGQLSERLLYGSNSRGNGGFVVSPK
ncbi:hypothetical protein WG66_000326 [Moniliophthora roreri]|nr:hypothetical protein WG66_000326 [Moniliophthora roreri]